MSIAALLSELQRRDVRVWLDGEQLRCDAPAGVMTPELQQELRARKQDLLDFLKAAQARARQQRAIVPLQAAGDRVPVFGVAGHNGDVFCYRALAHHLGREQPFFGLQPPGLDGHGKPLTSVEDLAAYFAADILAFRPDGPYILAGFCAGGTVAFELARQLQRAGGLVSYVALFGSPYPTWYRAPAQWAQTLADQMQRLVRHGRELASRSAADSRRYIGERLRERRARREAELRLRGDAALARPALVGRMTLAAVRRYRPGHFPGRIGLFLPHPGWRLVGGAALRWQALTDHSEQYFGPAGCSGYDMLLEPYAPAFAGLLRHALDLDECRESACAVRPAPPGLVAPRRLSTELNAP